MGGFAPPKPPAEYFDKEIVWCFLVIHTPPILA